MRRLAGIMIIAAIFGGLFAVCVYAAGWAVTTLIWGGALSLTALLVFAVYLITGPRPL